MLRCRAIDEVWFSIKAELPVTIMGSLWNMSWPTVCHQVRLHDLANAKSAVHFL